MALLVRVHDGSQGSDETRLFPTTPVRIGRNPLNDLALDYGFVSQWHGVIKFDRSEIIYVDLGSTNGTLLDGLKVQERTPVRLIDANAKLSIGPLEITLRWADAAEGGMALKPRIKTQFATSLPLSGGSPGTALPSAVPPGPIGTPGAVPEPLGGATDATERGAPTLAEPLMAVQQVQGSYDAYRQGWSRFLAELRSKIDSSPPALREMTAFFMASEFPQVTREPEFAQMLTDMGVDRMMAGCFDIEEWLDRLTHSPDTSSAKKVSPAIAMEHVGAILEVFADSFVELRKGYGQFEKEMGLQIQYDESPLDRASNLDEVISHLLDPNADPSERLNDLRRAFASFALHQVALIGASVEGARELLESLSPSSISQTSEAAPAGSNSIAVRGQELLSLLMKVWPIAPLASWSRYKHRYESTTEEDRFTRKLFGRKFIRAYLALIGSQDGK